MSQSASPIRPLLNNDVSDIEYVGRQDGGVKFYAKIKGVDAIINLQPPQGVTAHVYPEQATDGMAAERTAERRVPNELVRRFGESLREHNQSVATNAVRLEMFPMQP